MEQLLEIILNFFTEPIFQQEVNQAIIGGLITGIQGSRAARRARRRERKLMEQIEVLEASRQQVINPFAGVENVVTNPFANLAVATRAAEMQAQQTDLSLASTLDALRATGAGAGGATALAQAALSAKQGVAASIQQQEVRNQQLRAQGEARRQQFVAQAQARGRQFAFETQEQREMQKLNRLSALAGAASQQAAAAQSDAAAGFGAFAGGLFDLGLSAATGTGIFAGEDSDRRLKKNIKEIGRSPSGLKIYSFEYKSKKGLYQGVMSDEVPKTAVIVGDDGFDMVDYSKIDVEFKLIK